MEPGAPGLTCLPPGLFVHVSQHQHLAGIGVLHHRRHEAFRKIGTHCLTSRPIVARSRFTSETESSPKWKTEAASAASAPPAVRASYMCLAEPAPPDAITGSRTAELTARSSSRS